MSFSKKWIDSRFKNQSNENDESSTPKIQADISDFEDLYFIEGVPIGKIPTYEDVVKCIEEIEHKPAMSLHTSVAAVPYDDMPYVFPYDEVIKLDEKEFKDRLDKAKMTISKPSSITFKSYDVFKNADKIIDKIIEQKEKNEI